MIAELRQQIVIQNSWLNTEKLLHARNDKIQITLNVYLMQYILEAQLGIMKLIYFT